MKALISARLLASAQIKPGEKPYEIRDRDLVGFILRVQPSGRKSYLVQLARGRRVTIGTTCTLTPMQARDRAEKVLGNMAHGRAPLTALDPLRGMTLGEFIAQKYTPWALANRPRSAPETLKRLKRCFGKWHGKTLPEITAELIEDWKVERLEAGLSPTTVLRDILTLSGVLTRATRVGKLEHNPIRNVDKPRVDRRPKVRFLDAHEEACLRKALADRDRENLSARQSANEWRRERQYALLPEPNRFIDHLTAAVIVSMNTGLRRGELLTLQWTDIDFTEEFLTVRGSLAKTGDTRHVPLNAESLSVLRDWRRDSDANDRVFPVSTSFKSAWSSLLERARITKFRWHDLRHHFASRLAQAGVPLNTVRELLGHGSLAMTLRYAHLAPSQAREAVKMLLAVPALRPPTEAASLEHTMQ